MNHEAKNSLQKMIDDTVVLLNKRKLTDAILSAQTVSDLAEAEHDYYIYATAQNLMGVSYVAAGNEMSAVDCYLRGLSCCLEHQIDALFPLFYINLGSSYQEANDHKTAIEYFLKAENALSMEASKADPRYHGWCLVNSLNLMISSNHQMNFELGAEFLERCESLLTEKDMTDSIGISLLIIKCHLYWYTGRRDYVLEHLDSLIGQLHLIEPNDFVQIIRELIFLLKNMNDHTHFKQVIDYFRQYASEQNTLYYELLLCEFEMDYYHSIHDYAGYQDSCIRYTELFMKQKQERLKERTEAFTQKILLQQKETERRAAEHQSKIDALTGLGNRFLLEENLAAHLEYAIARQEKICLAIIDIDHFKTHNDLYGHMHGDHCLRLTASVLKSCVGKAGSVYRFGGDEFLVLLNITDYDSVRDIAENIKQHFNLDESEDITGSGLTVTLSQGYAICRTDADSRKDILISKADKALYAVKNSGRNNYLIFEED